MTAQPSNSTPIRRPIGFFAFWAVQACLLGAGVAWAGFRVGALDARLTLPLLRSQPLTFSPLYDYPVVVSDEQLSRVLTKLAPRSLGNKTKINHIDHALRFWGLAAKFDRADLLSGQEMRSILTDHRRFAQMYGPETKPLLIDFERGVRVRTQDGPISASHTDHTLAGLAEVGTPLDFPLVTPMQRTTYRAMLEQSLRDFSLNQIEYEWSALAYALYLPPTTRWFSSEGQEMTFDRLASRIMRQEWPQGVCFGNHRIYTLVAFLRIDEQTPILAPETRKEIMKFLGDTTRLLVASQHADGYWNGNWSADPAKSPPTVTSGDAATDRILGTGHALEWWAMAPQELHPPRDVLVKAGQWLSRTIDELSAEKIEEYYTYLSHAGRCLALWRSKNPSDVPLKFESGSGG